MGSSDAPSLVGLQGCLAMSKHIVFVRFFPDFSEPFPFERFACLSDSEVTGELEKLRLEELADVAKQRERKRARRLRKQAIVDWANAHSLGKDWLAQALRNCSADQPISEIANRILNRYPLAVFRTKELAEIVSTSLKEKVARLKRAALETNPFQGDAVFFEMANPWFAVIAEADLTSDQKLTVPTQIDRLFQADTKAISREEGFLRKYLPELKPILDAAVSEESIQSASSADSVSPTNSAKVKKNTKPSHAKGDARTKLTSALLAHHQYADGGCMNWEPIGNNELARAAGNVSRSSAKAFFDKYFKGHDLYKALCRRDSQRVLNVLKALNGDFAVDELFGDAPPNERDRRDE